MQIPPQNELYYGIGEKSEWSQDGFETQYYSFNSSFIFFFCILLIFFFYRYSSRTYRSTRIDIKEFTTITLITNYKETKKMKKGKEKNTLQGLHHLFDKNKMNNN